MKILLLIGLIFLSSCSGSSSSSGNNISGFAVDGYLANATVCIDSNANATCDNAENSTTTNENGYFSLKTSTNADNQTMLVIGGVDSASSKNFAGKIKKLMSSSDDKNNIIISPITTMVHNAYKKGNSIDIAKQKIATALNLSIDKLSTNPMLDTDVFASTQKIIQNINILTKSIESDVSKNTNAFEHLTDVITTSLITENTFDTDKIITQLESVKYGTQTISIATSVKNAISSYTATISSKTSTITNIQDLANLQFGFENHSDKLKANLGSATAMTDILTDFNSAAIGSLTTTWYKPNKTTTWQWQLKVDSGKSLNTTYDVGVYDIDLFDVSTSTITALKQQGKKVICYFSGGSWEDWRDDKDSFPESSKGNVMDGWADEKWLYINDLGLRSVMSRRLDLAKQKGCDGVEPDNMDGYLSDNYNNSKGVVSANDQIIYNKWMAAEAHKRGLAVGLKNDLDQIKELEPYFDFAVNEQCQQYGECDKLQPFIDANKPVWAAEYADGTSDTTTSIDYVNNITTRNQMCANAKNLEHQTLILPLDLADGFRVYCGDAPF